MNAKLLFPIAIACTLAACADKGGEYPSLAIRDVERTAFAPIDPPVSELQAPSSQTIAQVGSLQAEARATHARFMRELPAARQAVSRAGTGTIDNPRRGDALVLLGVLDGIHGETLAALSALDQIYAEALTQNVEASAIAAVRSDVETLANDEEANVTALARQLGQ